MDSLLWMRSARELPLLGALFCVVAVMGCSGDEGTPPECVPGQPGLCRGGTFYECSGDAEWELVEACDGGCDADMGCIAGPCTDGNTRCDGNTVQMCTGGEYRDSEICAGECTAGVCEGKACGADDTTCAEGQTCQDNVCIEVLGDGNPVVGGGCESFSTVQSLDGEFQVDIPSSWLASGLLVRDTLTFNDVDFGPGLFYGELDFEFVVSALEAATLSPEQVLLYSGEYYEDLGCELSVGPERLEIAGYADVRSQSWVCEGFYAWHVGFLTAAQDVVGWFVLGLTEDNACDNEIAATLLGSFTYIDPEFWSTP